jgi:hypothetical protein
MSQTAAALFPKVSALPADFLNAYEISNTSSLSWPVAIYRLQRLDQTPLTHEDRGAAKSVVWNLRREYKSRCRGYGFVIDISETLVVVPEGWKLPSGIDYENYHITRDRELVARASNPQDEAIVSGIIREALKKQFKDKTSDYLGCLWQDMDRFCQLPKPHPGDEYCMCRRFGTSPKLLRGNRWVVECIVGTATIDGRAMSDYYNNGQVEVLARMIQVKRGAKVDRRNQPIAVRVLHDASDEHHISVRALEISDPAVILRHANLTAREQRALTNSSLACRPFKQASEELPLNELRLILDSQITQEDHSETIVEPREREVFMSRMRDLIHGADLYGHQLRLADAPFDMSHLEQGFILPPSTRVIGDKGNEIVLSAPTIMSEEFLKKRFRQRSEHVRRNGFLQSRPINPLLAWPRQFGDLAVRRMENDLNHLLEDQDAPFRFNSAQYADVDEIRKHIEAGGHDSLLAVLPEGRLAPHTSDSTHEVIKQRIEVPSQCIQCDHTLPRKWLTKPHSELLQNDSRLARRIQQRYELCITSLLVKHHWVPFAPVDPFSFNVQIGLDVGGTHNTHAVSCLGYGFGRPQDGLIFRPDEIPIDVQKKEPIPTGSLYAGLLRQFEVMRASLIEAGKQPDFERALFYRDGPLHGDGDAWNEKDAITDLHTYFLRRGWVSENSVWTAVEIMKYAEGWRLFRGEGEVRNPIAGRYVFAFDDPDRALVCTTGSQSLTQGTACPLMVKAIDIYGHSNRLDVIRDLVWQADMCFTKPDVGMRLPWVLHVADVGALQQSRSYLITGITT